MKAAADDFTQLRGLSPRVKLEGQRKNYGTAPCPRHVEIRGETVQQNLDTLTFRDLPVVRRNIGSTTKPNQRFLRVKQP